MKKALFVITLVVVFAAGSVNSYARHKGSMKDKGEMKGKKAMHCMMMDKMMPKKMVATPDGGVIVLTGNKLLKYDQNLNLVKETEVKMDVESMMNKMKECRDRMKACKEKMKDMEEDKDSE